MHGPTTSWTKRTAQRDRIGAMATAKVTSTKRLPMGTAGIASLASLADSQHFLANAIREYLREAI